MNLGPYLGLLAQHRFRIHPIKWPMFLLGAGVSTVNSLLSLTQQVIYGRRIERTELVAPPIFIIGHWRSGTTLLHELLTLDDQFSFPNNFDSFTPNHLLVSRRIFYPVVYLLLPGKRPMDGMSLGASSPQEDDFALVSLNAPTMYREIAFPNDRFAAELEPSENDRIRTIDNLERFFKILTLRYQKRLVLKSPPHTARIKDLAQRFPGAKFVHISRDPSRIVPSTARLWRTLDDTQGFQLPRYSDEKIFGYIHQRQKSMYRRYFLERDQIPSGDLIEVRFEDLIADPVATTRHVYETFSLNGFEEMESKIRSYFSERSDVKPSTPSRSPELQRSINEHWREYLKNFGYSAEDR